MTNYIRKNVGMNRHQKRVAFVQDMRRLTQKPEGKATKGELQKAKSLQRGKMKIELLVARGIKHNRRRKYIFMNKLTGAVKEALR